MGRKQPSWLPVIRQCPCVRSLPNRNPVQLILAAMTLPFTISARVVRPGECGEYMYWKDGKCVDARNAPLEPWTDQMAKKKATW